MKLSKLIPIFEAIVKLMEPLLEVVVHDLKENRVKYICGQLSSRRIGSPSFIEAECLGQIEEITYPKINFDGKLIKSISVRLDDELLLCINCDISIFNKMQILSKTLLQTSERPTALFANDWKEKVNTEIHSYIQKNNMQLEHLTQNNKKEVSKHLFNIGAFNEKNSAEYIAKILNLGRATIFKYLKEWRSK